MNSKSKSIKLNDLVGLMVELKEFNATELKRFIYVRTGIMLSDNTVASRLNKLWSQDDPMSAAPLIGKHKRNDAIDGKRVYFSITRKQANRIKKLGGIVTKVRPADDKSAITWGQQFTGYPGETIRIAGC